MGLRRQLPQLTTPRGSSATLAQPLQHQQAAQRARGSTTEQPRSEPLWARQLDGRESAVDRQCRAVDIRGVVAYQERDRGRDLFWCAGSLRRGAGDNALNPVGMDSHNRGDCRPGRYGVDADTGWSI